MNKAHLKKFKTMLEEKRDEIVKKAKQTLSEDMMLDANDLRRIADLLRYAPDRSDIDERWNYCLRLIAEATTKETRP